MFTSPGPFASRGRARTAANVGGPAQGTTVKRYQSADGSGVAAYETGPGWIIIRFHRGGTYRYDARNPGALHVTEMQRLADSGEGLNTYINKYVRDDYAERLA